MYEKFGCDKKTSFAKDLLVTLNIVLFILGVSLIIIGYWISVDKTSLFNLIVNPTIAKYISDEDGDYYFTVGSVMLNITGGFIALLNMLGFCGAIKDSKGLLISYVCGAIGITLIQTTVIILLAMFEE